jgi:hypothetical protein
MNRRRTLPRWLRFACVISVVLAFAVAGIPGDNASATVTSNATTYQGNAGTFVICNGCVTTVAVSAWATTYPPPIVISVVAASGCDDYTPRNRYTVSAFGLYAGASDIVGYTYCNCIWQMAMVNGT